MMAKKNTVTKTVPSHKGETHKRSPWYPLLLCVMMWGGFALGIFSWIPTGLTVLGKPSSVLGIPGGLIALAGVFLMIYTVKCPACGEKKLGRAMGTKVPKKCECPDCHATVEVEWPQK